MQKHLHGRLSILGAAYVRFLYAIPLALVYLLIVFLVSEAALPVPGPGFFGYALAGGICQILFTVFLLWLFSFHNFAVGTTISKLETVMVAIFGLLLLGDTVSLAVVVAIAISSIGLVVLSAGQSRLGLSAMLAGLWRLPTLVGLICAAWLGASVVFFRAASLSLDLANFALAAAFTLSVVIVLQALLMTALIALREPGQLSTVMRHWRPASLVGLSGGLASIGWFSAFTLQNATYVRALGQIELLFTFVATLIFFKEKVSLQEIVGILLITVSILIILLAA